MTTRYQITDLTGSWWNISADKDESATIFDTREEAEQMIPSLARSLEMSAEEFKIVERASEMTEDEFFDRVRAAGFKGQICRTDERPYQVVWTGNTEILHLVGGVEIETDRITAHATPEEAVQAAESR